MKILKINNFFTNNGGAEIVMHNTASLLERKGYQVYFFATDKKPYFDEKYNYTNYFPIYINYNSLTKADSFRYLLRPFYNIEAEQKLNKLIKKIKPDIVHCHNIVYHLTPSVLNACYGNNIPVVMTIHDTRLFCPSGTLMKNGNNYCALEHCIQGNPIHCIINKCKNKSIISSAITSGEYLFNKMHRLYDKVSLFICPSKALLELAARGGINRDKLVVINNFIDDHKFKHIPEYTNKGYFLYVGRLSREKGVHYLIEAMSKVSRSIGLHIIGTGSEEESLKSLAKKHNLDNVKFLGFKSGLELELEYKNCIATVLPSNWFEIFGLTILESFTYGKPVIASNIGGIPEIVDHYKNGFIVRPGNIDELSTAINKLYSDHNLTVEMGKNGRRKAEENYNSRKHYSNLTDTYMHVIEYFYHNV